MQVTIAGSGGWGTALAILLHENGHDVTLWSHFETESKQLAETHQNPYLPGWIQLYRVKVKAILDEI